MEMTIELIALGVSNALIIGASWGSTHARLGTALRKLDALDKKINNGMSSRLQRLEDEHRIFHKRCVSSDEDAD